MAKLSQYVHVTSTAYLTHYSCHTRCGREAIDEISILPQYRGTCVHVVKLRQKSAEVSAAKQERASSAEYEHYPKNRLRCSRESLEINFQHLCDFCAKPR